jgi:ubiquinone/menaquinone biosynthesis C-methylase UbiE
MALATETEVGAAYRGRDVAQRYISERFVSELHRLLHERQVGAVQRAIDELQPKRILEIAPGPGRLTRDVRPSGQLFALEFNAGMIAEGQACCPSTVQWIQGNAFHLPFAAAEFDLIYTFRFIRHFKLADRSRLYQQVQRVLQPSGVFIMDAVNRRISAPLRVARPDEYPIYDELYSEWELRDELAQHRFSIQSMESVQKRFSWQSRSQILIGPRANWLNRCLIRGLEWLPARDGLEWIVTCGRA